MYRTSGDKIETDAFRCSAVYFLSLDYFTLFIGQYKIVVFLSMERHKAKCLLFYLCSVIRGNMREKNIEASGSKMTASGLSREI